MSLGAEAALLMRQAHATLLPFAPWGAIGSAADTSSLTDQKSSTEGPAAHPGGKPQVGALLHADAVLALLHHSTLQHAVPRECVVLAAATYAAAGPSSRLASSSLALVAYTACCDMATI